MKSFLSMLPLAALALAQEPCSQDTMTQTLTNKITVTVPAQPVSTPSELPPSAAEPDSASVVEKTTWVTSSPAASVVPSFPCANGTSNYTTFIRSTLATIILPSSVAAESPTAIESAATTAALAETSRYPEASESAMIPASGTLAAVATSEAPAEAAATSSQVTTDAATNSGEATFYGGNVSGGMCSFTGYSIPSGIYGTALSDANWAGAGNCGACVSVTGPNGNSIKAMVVDQCPGCGTNHLDLFADAFAKLAEPSKGVIDVSWSIVPCGITSPLILKNKEGTSPYWFSMQVMNANVAVSKLEVSIDGGSTWKATTRQPYNYFENSSGFGKDSVDVKVTSVNGGTVIVKDVSIAASTTKTAGSNFS